MAWNFTSKAKVASLFGISSTVLQDEWSDWVEGLIKNYEGKDYISATSSVTETHDGDGTNLIVTNQSPIVSVTTLSIDSSAVSSADYKVYDSYVKLIATSNPLLVTASQQTGLHFPEGEQNVSITYVAGTATVPVRVEWAATQMIGIIAQFSARKGVDSSLQFSSTTGTRGESRPAGQKLHKMVNDVMVEILGRKARFD